jgi:hypothetical protein
LSDNLIPGGKLKAEREGKELEKEAQERQSTGKAQVRRTKPVFYYFLAR